MGIINDRGDRDDEWWKPRQFWFAGCLSSAGNSFRFTSVDTMHRENPKTSQELLCHNLLAEQDAGVVVEPFCQGAHLNIRFRDALTNSAVDSVHASVIRVEDNADQLISEGAVADLQGELNVGLTQNGRYRVQVAAAGSYMGGHEEVDVDCSLSSCDACHPTLLLPLTPTVEADTLRLVLGWGVAPDNLDLYAVKASYRNPCFVSAIHRTGCDGVTMKMDNMLAGDEGLETMTFHDISSQEDTVYMIFVHQSDATLLGSPSILGRIGESSAHVSVTDGTLGSEIHLEAAGQYSGEKYWVAGCLRLGTNFQFTPVNAFFTISPQFEVPFMCLDLLGMATTTTTTTTTESSNGWWSNIFG